MATPSDSPQAATGLPEAGEHLALALTQAGMQRMIARTLAAFLFSDRESVTAGELGRQLGASAGSISGAITMLRTVGLIEQVPAPSSRRDHYRMRPDAWATLMTSKNAMIGLMREIADAGLSTVPSDGPAAARLRRMRDFYAYMLAELPALIERWYATQPPDDQAQRP
ncbi:GbsR/MarR family transcriptional regulator [Pseudonocardia humida]|uniref:MarR family transcriptional regulator n=1 Tax=Pseudonocardia humida TaxID=2800819 RepID=A0ABT1AC22_9PSEU|nr:MarR family transcriptional regulator [Pseudonocardia humida]MCO1660577.1 MarR family transcriptional regulator [Pseudonocardia humida]